MGNDRRLNALEASFVGLESPGLPMHVGGLTVFDGRDPVTLGELREMMASRLRRLPKFRQRLADGPLGLARGRWTTSRIDFDAHLFHHTLHAPGRSKDLFALCARIHETALSRERPLWEMHLIDGLEHRRQALLIKTHHSITDGLAGIEIAEALFDPADGAPRPTLPATRYAVPPAPIGWAAVQAALGLAFMAAGGPLALPGPFNGPVGPHRGFGAITIPMEGIRRLKRTLGGSIDDVIVATVAAGLHRYLTEVRYPEVPHALRAMLPVSTRPPAPRMMLGNHVSSIFIDLPMRSDDISELLPVIVHEKATLRTAHAAAGASLLVEGAALLPAPLHRPVLQIVSALPFAHLVLSDVPGPDVRLSVLGRPIVAVYPLMPLTRDIGLSIATVSMGGQLGVGVTSDPGLVPNPQRVASAIGRAFAACQPAIAPAPHRHAARRAA